jgi:alpha-L-rhamnosidase
MTQIDMSDRSKWISTEPQADRRNAPLFRREFSLDSVVGSSMLNISGLGYYEAWINGERVGDHVLDPAQTDYEQRVFYVTYDVTALLREGINCIAVMLGNGWYNQDRVWGVNGLSYGEPKLFLELSASLSNGNRVIVNTDSTWKCARGPVTDNNIYAGERYDARLEQQGWNCAGFDDSSWDPVLMAPAPGGRLEQQKIPPIRKIEELPPVAISRSGSQKYVVDMGQNLSGWVRIRVTAEAGREIRMRFAETLDESGNIDTASTGIFATKVEQTDRYICKGGVEEIWEPRFTYHGFRYVEVAGWPGELTTNDITGVVVHTDLQSAGIFECSDARLNHLHRMALWTHRDNIHGIPEDCPARERCGWLGDANLVAEYSIWNYHGKAFWEKFLGDIETARILNNGIPTNIAPGKRGARTNGNPDWLASYIMLPWYLYKFYGDSAVLEQYWDGMTQLMDHYARLADGWILSAGFGDYFDPGTDAIVSHTPVALTSSLWFYRCATVMSAAAKVLQFPDSANTFAEWRESISAAISERFFERDCGTFGSQGANVLALAFGVLPEEEERIFEALVEDIIKRDTHLNVGVMGVRYLFEELTQRGRGDLALALMHKDSYPSFGNLIQRGATTLWESWGEEVHNETHGPRSLNHPFMGGYDNWFYNTLAGICPDSEVPGFRHFFLTPYPIPGLEWACAKYNSPHGQIVSDWLLTNRVFEWKVTIPQNSNATATLPFSGSVKKLGPGTHGLTDRIG